eukprot:363736-Chlamydomonas_euryale.AAC.8
MQTSPPLPTRRLHHVCVSARANAAPCMAALKCAGRGSSVLTPLLKSERFSGTHCSAGGWWPPSACSPGRVHARTRLVEEGETMAGSVPHCATQCATPVVPNPTWGVITVVCYACMQHPACARGHPGTLTSQSATEAH